MAATKTQRERRLRLHTLAISCTDDQDPARLSLDGELDISTVALLEGELHRLAADGCNRVVIDMTSLSFLDSTGIHLLSCAHTRSTRRDATLQIRPPADGPARRVLEVSGLLRILNTDEQETVAA